MLFVVSIRLGARFENATSLLNTHPLARKRVDVIRAFCETLTDEVVRCAQHRGLPSMAVFDARTSRFDPTPADFKKQYRW